MYVFMFDGSLCTPLRLYVIVALLGGSVQNFAISKLPVSILYKSIAGRYRPVSYPDGPITAHYRFIKNAYWASFSVYLSLQKF